MKYCFLIIGIFIMSSVKSQNIVTDRPGQSDASTVIPKSSFQIETGFSFEEDGNNNQITYLPISLFRIGVTNKIELRVLSKIMSFNNDLGKKIGFGDIELGTKIQILSEEGGNTNLAFVQNASFATGSLGFSSPYVGLTSKLLFSQQLTDNWGLSSNLIYYNSNSKKGDFNYTLNFSYSVSDKLSIFIENYGGLSEIQYFSSNMDSGLAFLISNNFQVDVAFGIGLTQQSNYVAFGCSWNVVRKDKVTFR